MNRQELEQLRQKILGDITPLVVDSTTASADQFSLLLRLLQSGNATPDLYQKAYASAAAIEDKDDRLDAMMNLLDEVEVELDETAPDEPEAPEEPTPVAESPSDMPPIEQIPAPQPEPTPEGENQ